MLQAERDAAAFAGMTWADPSFEEEQDGCLLLGEEASPDGKQWFLCSQPSPDPGVECVKDMLSVDAVARTYEASYLCKAPKVSGGAVQGGLASVEPMHATPWPELRSFGF